MRVSRALLALILCLGVSACTFSATGSIETDPDRIEVALEFATFTPQATQTPTAVSTATDTPLPPTATPEPSATATEQPTPTPTVTCDHTILPTMAQFDGRAVLPGQTVCLPSGTRGKLDLFNLHGAAGLPIRVVPAGGVVTIRAEPDQITRVWGLYDATHLVVDGGEAGAECGTYLSGEMPLPYAPQACGIRVLGGGVGIRADRNVSDLHFSHVEVGDSNPAASFAAGFLVRDANGGVFRNLVIRNSFAHDTANECIYISYAVSQATSPFENVAVTRNYLTRCAWGSLNLKQITRGEAAYNVVDTVGVANEISNGHGNGMDVVRSDHIWIHHNRIFNTAEECIKTLALLSGATLLIEHNFLGACGNRRAEPSSRLHVRDTHTSVQTTVRFNELSLPGLGLDVRGTGDVHDNVWR